MSKSDRCCRVLSDAFADQFRSCLLILLVLSPPHTTSHHRHHKYQLAQNMSELYQSCVFTDVKTNMSLKTDTHCLLSFLSFFSPSSSVVLLQCSIPLLHFHFLPFTFNLSPIMLILTVSNSVMSLRRHIQLPWSSRETLAIERLQFQSSRFHPLGLKRIWQKYAWLDLNKVQ